MMDTGAMMLPNCNEVYIQGGKLTMNDIQYRQQEQSFNLHLLMTHGGVNEAI